MKQHITVEQLNELSEKGQQKLKMYWKPQEGDMCLMYNEITNKPIVGFIDDIDCDNEGKIVWIGTFEGGDSPEYTLPLFSIGQMVKFMRDNRTMMGIDWFLDERKRCDKLWEMVKKILEKP